MSSRRETLDPGTLTPGERGAVKAAIWFRLDWLDTVARHAAETEGRGSWAALTAEARADELRLALRKLLGE
jgi:hypothetical protein